MNLSPKDLEALLDGVGLHRVERTPDELNFERSLTDNALRTLAPAAAPSDLPLRIRLALSHERVRASKGLAGRMHDALELFFENRLRPFALQISVASVVLFAVFGGALMLGALAPQQTVEANDEPLAGFSAPRFLYSAGGDAQVGSTDDTPLMVQAQVDAKGRVYDYRVLSGSLDANAEAALRQRMLTGVFQPARVFGQPVRGRVVLTFADVVVRG
jgi:hypothetical protein